MALTQLVTGTSTSATTTVNFTAQAAGTLLVLVVGADDYRGTTGSGRPESTGWTLPTGGAQQTNLGHYLWYKLTDGTETSVQYKINSASGSVYWLGAFSESIDQTTPLDSSDGNSEQFGGFTHAFPSVSTTSGDRVAVAAAGAAQNPLGVTGTTGWTNSYTQVGFNRNLNGGGTGDAIGIAYLSFTGGSTTTTTVTYQGANPDAATGILAVFKVAEGGEEPVDGSVTSVAATATALAVAPAASGVEVTNGEVTAVVATATAQAEVPVVTGEALVEGGGPATASAEAKAPTVSAVRNASVTGVAATGSAGAASPVVSAVGAGAVISVAATATSQAAAPSVSAVRNASVTGVKATATSAAQAPAVAGVRNAAVAAAVATATALANEVAASGVTSGPQAAPVATATAQFHAPVVSAFLTGGVTAVAASATAEAGEPAAEGVIVITFRPPTHSVRFASVENDRLFGRMSTQVGYAVLLRKDGTYEMTRFIDPDRTDVEKVYGGGRVNVLTEDEADALTEAGYGQYIQPPR